MRGGIMGLGAVAMLAASVGIADAKESEEAKYVPKGKPERETAKRRVRVPTDPHASRHTGQPHTNAREIARRLRQAK